MTYSRELEFSKKLAKEVWQQVKKYYVEGIHYDLKKDNSAITIADKEANKIIVSRIQKEFPADGIVSEEAENIEGKRVWYVDPIDGTNGFINHNGDFAIHIALVENKTPVIGVVYKCVNETCYFAEVKKGAFIEKNGKISPLKTRNISRPLTATASSTRKHELNDKIIKKINPEAFFRSGSEGLRLMTLVENKSDFRITTDYTCSWDLCAPHIILSESGGFIEFIDGTNIEYTSQRKMSKRALCAGTKKTFEVLKKKIRFS